MPYVFSPPAQLPPGGWYRFDIASGSDSPAAVFNASGGTAVDPVQQVNNAGRLPRVSTASTPTLYLKQLDYRGKAGAVVPGSAVELVGALQGGGVPPGQADLTDYLKKADAAATYQQKPLTRALVKLYGGIANRLTTPCRIAFLGSSTTAGQNATAPEKRYVNLLVASLQSAYPSGLGTETAVIASTTADWGSLSTAVGVHGYNAGRGGMNAVDYVDSTTRPKIAALNPSMVLHMIGANDYREGVAVATFKAQLLSQVNQLKSAISGPCVHLLVAPYPRSTSGGSPVAPWSAYATAMAEIAVADPDNVAFLDLTEDYALLGWPGADPLNLIDTDDIHQTDAGHAYMFDSLRRRMGVIQVSGAAPVLVSPPAALSLTATPGDGQVTLSSAGGSGGTSYALYRSATVTGSPIASGSSLSAINITDTGRTNGTPVSYVATATNAQGTATSNSATVTPQAAGAGGYDYTADAALLGEWDGDNLGAAGEQVTTWSKKRGSWTTNFTQATASAKATVSSSAQMINGRKVLHFDGNDLMGVTPNTVVAGPYTIFSLWRMETTTQTRIYGSDQTSKVALLNVAAGPGALAINNGAGTTGQTGTSLSAAGTPAANAPHLVAAVYNGANSRVYLDALTGTSGPLVTGDGTELTHIRLGASATPSLYLTGQIGHFLVIGRALSDAEVRAVMTTLASRYGLTLGA